MSALAPKADMCGATRDVRFGPIADIAPISSPYFQSDLVDLAGKSSLRTDADSLSDRCLIVDADVSGLVRREDVGLRLLNPPLGDRFSIHIEYRLATLAHSA